MYDMTGKVVLITGGSRGLGRAMALGFASRGANVAIVSRKLDSCIETAKEIEALGVEAFAYAAHVGDWDEIGNMVDAVYERFGKVDVLVNNAGMSPLYPALDEISEALFDKVIAVNLKGPFRLSALVAARMVKGEGGSIINVSSVASVTKSPNAEPYGAAKAGLNAITRSFADAYGPKVRVNCIMAGPFLTDISKAWDLDAFNARAEATIPLQRGGQPEEVVGAALYFGSEMSSYTTGAILAIDGGSH
ncbi:MAG: NAD(P)-dependent dehydrogenase (short-subunit alcohol dehydrogenase family) [Candidatus Azotimanducaceae bacterium]|jgi:NAD(P)-dependent dehydrogenase (short-subunit alcohol dehydrogenase family)